MSLSSALSAALSGIQVSSTAAQLISANISNANTQGYTEKSANISEQVINGGSGGAVISGYSRVSDSVLSATLNNATSNAGYQSTLNSYMTQIQSMLDSSSDNPAFTSAVAAFQSAWTQFSAAPEDVTQQKAVVSAGQTLAQTINTLGTQLSAMKTTVQTDLSTSVTTLNNDLTKIQTLNNQISSAISNNQPAGDLEDQRDQAVNEIASLTTVQVMPRGQGQIALYTPGGTTLIDGTAQTFSVNGTSIVNAVGADVTGVLTGGKLQAQTDFLSTSGSTTNGVGTLNNLTSQLQNFANMFISTASGGFAATYNGSATSTGELGTGFFTATLDSNGLPDLGSFAVNASLISGAATVKQSATAVANVFTSTSKAINTATTPATTSNTFSASGLTVQNQTFAGIASSILSTAQQAANALQSASSTATTQQTYYQSALSNETGVNTDTELVNLTNWQNSYAAAAHVISTVQDMLKTLESMIS